LRALQERADRLRMMPRYLYVAADLASAGAIETDALVPTTERHKVQLDAPPLAPIGDLTDRVVRDGVDGVVLQFKNGALDRGHLRAAARILSAGKRLWFHWPSEGA